MMKMLAREQFPWWDVRFFQADERVAPLGSPECALTYLNQEFLSSLPPPPDHMHLMLVDDPELATAARHSEMLLHVLGVGNAKELKTLPSRTGS